MSLLKKNSKPEAPKNEVPSRSVSYTVKLGDQETLRTITDAWNQARCLGVPDNAQVRIYSYHGMYGSDVSVTFSWSEAMR
jgi:hypothetical protein